MLLRRIISNAMLCTALMIIGACSKSDRTNNTLVIFHAGSLSMPVKEMKAEFEKENPGTNIVLEAVRYFYVCRLQGH